MTFQQQVNLYPSLGREGTIASGNPIAASVPPQGGYKAGTGGVYIGRFVWADSTDASLVKNTGTGSPLGLIINTGKALIAVGDSASMLIQEGTDVAPMAFGDFWVKTSTAATVGQKVFAVLADGTIKTGAAGATVTGAVETSYIASSAGDANSLIKITKWVL